MATMLGLGMDLQRFVLNKIVIHLSGFMLIESGSFLLLEDGSKIILE